MNTKTMRLPPRRVLTPSTTTATTNKRKEREEPFDRPKPITTTTATTANSKLLKPDRPTSKPISEPITTTTSTSSSSSKGLELPPSNQLIAGYLAHEYLTKGTLFGQPWASARAEVPVVAERKKEKAGEESGGGGAVVAPPCRRAEEEERERYAKVAGLLKNGGVHLQGVVNPTQLARVLHL